MIIFFQLCKTSFIQKSCFIYNASDTLTYELSIILRQKSKGLDRHSEFPHHHREKKRDLLINLLSNPYNSTFYNYMYVCITRIIYSSWFHILQSISNQQILDIRNLNMPLSNSTVFFIFYKVYVRFYANGIRHFHRLKQHM